MTRFFASFVLFIATIVPALAMENDVLLGKYENWSVHLNHYNDATLHCSISSYNKRASIILSVDQAGYFRLFGVVRDVSIHDDVIDLPTYIDGDGWLLNHVTVNPTDEFKGVFWEVSLGTYDDAKTFLKALYVGNTYQITITGGRDVYFSLKGTASAMLRQGECWDDIRPWSQM